MLYLVGQRGGAGHAPRRNPAYVYRTTNLNNAQNITVFNKTVHPATRYRVRGATPRSAGAVQYRMDGPWRMTWDGRVVGFGGMTGE